MTYKDAWEIIQFKHCEDTCDFGQMEDCQGERCEYYMALKALNAQYYAEGEKILTDRKTENSSEKPNNCKPQKCSVNGRPYSECSSCEHFRCTADEPQTERSE